VTRARPRLAAAALTAALAAGACTRYQDMERIKTSIREGVERQTGAAVSWVECPPRRAAKPGDRFECRAGIEGGAVTLELVQDEYANVNWTQRELVLDLRKLEETIRAGLLRDFSLGAEVVCPGRHRPSIPGTRFECEARPKGGDAIAIPVLVKDAKAQVDWSVPKALAAPLPNRGLKPPAR
jgi:hypothetical protein